MNLFATYTLNIFVLIAMLSIAQLRAMMPLPEEVLALHAHEFRKALVCQRCRTNNTFYDNTLLNTFNNDHLNCFQILLENGADPNTKNHDAYTILGLVCIADKATFIPPLLKHDADINLKSNGHHTPLFLACGYGSTNCVRLLIANKADLKIVDNNGDTPLHEACSGDCIACISLLMFAGANIYAQNTATLTPLEVAKQNYHKNAVALIMSFMNTE